MYGVVPISAEFRHGVPNFRHAVPNWPTTSQVFAHHLGVGAASYHFNLEEPYISYENAPENWKLDDGSELPAKKKFTNWSYDGDARKFCAEIRWEPVTFYGENLWVYEMVFNENFTEIESGECKRYLTEGYMYTTTFSSQEDRETLHYTSQKSFSPCHATKRSLGLSLSEVIRLNDLFDLTP